MKLRITCFYILVFNTIAVFSQDYNEYLLKAEKSYKEGDLETAKQMYLKAAELGSADAHFAIGYKFIVPKEEKIFHFSEAAKLGHAEALKYALDALLLRANSITDANPEKALEIYETAKKKNPSLTLYDEENIIITINKCAEAGSFDTYAFIEEYDLEEEVIEANTPYHIWKLAEEASIGGRFGDPDPTLTFQLICRGSWVPAELEIVVNEFYEYWKKNIVKEFDICNYVTSGDGINFCSLRDEEKAQMKLLSDLKNIINSVDENTQPLVEPAYHAAVRFIEEKAWKEEGHDGSGYITWTSNSIEEQKANYLNLIREIKLGTVPADVKNLKDSNKEMKLMYKSVLARLKDQPIQGMHFRIDQKSLKDVQKIWIPYRDKSALLFSHLSPEADMDFWESWLTQIRTSQLKKILELEY